MGNLSLSSQMGVNPVALPKRTRLLLWSKSIALLLILLFSLILMERPIVVSTISSAAPSEKQQYKDTILTPLLRQLHEQNQLALHHLQTSIQDDFIEWKIQLPRFIEELNELDSQIGLLGIILLDGQGQAARAVQKTFGEQVVSTEQIKRVMLSHIADFQQQLAENRQNFFIEVGKALDDSHFRVVTLNQFHRQINDTRQQQLNISRQMANKVAVAPILSFTVASIAEKVIKRVIPSVILKGARGSIVTAIFAFSVDWIVSDYLEDEMLIALNQKMDHYEQTIIHVLQDYGRRQMMQDESALAILTK